MDNPTLSADEMYKPSAELAAAWASLLEDSSLVSETEPDIVVKAEPLEQEIPMPLASSHGRDRIAAGKESRRLS